ncbi:hypothetical protein V5799_006758 [Amblyomma americanum]|uniref:Uncharacterized protein n=1 Tax=Amblyomma americanum TaxID=6943 RepID=A0AAQ4DVG8_AMBAM
MTFADLWKKLGEDKTHVLISWMAARYASLFVNYELVSNYYGTTNKDFIKYMHEHWCYELAYVFFGDFLFAPYNAIVFQRDVRRDVEHIALNIRNEFQARLSKRLTHPVDAYMEVLWSSLEAVLSWLTTTVHQRETESIEINSLLPDMNLSLTRNLEAAWKTTRRASNATPPQKLGWRAVHMFLPYDLRFGDFVLALYILLFPCYDMNVVDAVKYGALGAHMAKASVDLFLNNYAISNLTDQAAEDALDCASMSDTTKATKTLSDVTPLDVLLQVFAAYGSQWMLAGLKSLTATQLLFIAWCYIRCCGYSEPLDDECNTAVKHATAFSTAFTCTRGAPLNVEKKCSIF